VVKAISELPQNLKNPLILTALEGRSYAHTGELLGISSKAVEMKVYRARKLLLKKMGEKAFKSSRFFLRAGPKISGRKPAARVASKHARNLDG